MRAGRALAAVGGSSPRTAQGRGLEACAAALTRLRPRRVFAPGFSKDVAAPHLLKHAAARGVLDHIADDAAPRRSVRQFRSRSVFPAIPAVQRTLGYLRLPGCIGDGTRSIPQNGVLAFHDALHRVRIRRVLAPARAGPAPRSQTRRARAPTGARPGAHERRAPPPRRWPRSARGACAALPAPVNSGGKGICQCGISGRRRPVRRASIVSIAPLFSAADQLNLFRARGALNRTTEGAPRWAGSTQVNSNPAERPSAPEAIPLNHAASSALTEANQRGRVPGDQPRREGPITGLLQNLTLLSVRWCFARGPTLPRAA
jgi:hypothetical protein